MNEELVEWIKANPEEVEKMTKISAGYLAGYIETDRLQEQLSYRTLIYNDLGQDVEFTDLKPEDKLIYLNSLISLLQEEHYNNIRSIEKSKIKTGKETLNDINP